MAYSGFVAARPLEIGCLQTFKKSYKESVVRTESDNSAFIKTRRRTTAPVVIMDCSITLHADVVTKFEQWYTVACACGAQPTRIRVPPAGAEIIARFSSAPQIEWIDKNAATVTFSMEQLPLWAK